MAARGTLRPVIHGVRRAAANGLDEYKTAVIDDVTCCSAQKIKPYGTAIMVNPRMMVAFHSRPGRGNWDCFTKAANNKSKAAIRNLAAAARKGGTSRTTTRIAIHVEPQIAQSVAKAR